METGNMISVPESESRIATCDGCGTHNIEVKRMVHSCFHPHNAARGVQKFIGVDIGFTNLKTGEPAELCKPCQILVIGGTKEGCNWK